MRALTIGVRGARSGGRVVFSPAGGRPGGRRGPPRVLPQGRRTVRGAWPVVAVQGVVDVGAEASAQMLRGLYDPLYALRGPDLGHGHVTGGGQRAPRTRADPPGGLPPGRLHRTQIDIAVGGLRRHPGEYLRRLAQHQAEGDRVEPRTAVSGVQQQTEQIGVGELRPQGPVEVVGHGARYQRRARHSVRRDPGEHRPCGLARRPLFLGEGEVHGSALPCRPGPR